MFSRVEDILTKNPTIPQSRVEDLLVQLMEGLPTDEHIRDLVGSPLKADTVSEMTDDTKIYIYTGSETGYTAGHWYYYNGSSWADGGVYNSAGINTDKTLSVEDKAADGKAVGDELTDLKSDLSDLFVTTPGESATLTNLKQLSGFKVYGFTKQLSNDVLIAKIADGNTLVSPYIIHQSVLGSGTWMVGYKYRLTKLDSQAGDPEKVSRILGLSDKNDANVVYDEWITFNKVVNIDLTRVYFSLYGYSTPPTENQVQVEIKDFFIYDVEGVSNDLLEIIANKQRTSYKDGTVTYSVNDTWTPDTTLSMEGIVADSKAVGDAIEGVSGDVIALDNKLSSVVTTKTATLTDRNSVAHIFTSGAWGFSSESEGVCTFFPNHNTDVNVFGTNGCNLGSGKWLVSFKFRLTKLDSSLSDPVDIRFILGQSDGYTRTDYQYDTWLDFTKISEVNLTRVYFSVRGFSTAPTSSQIKLEIKEFYIYDVTNVSLDLYDTIINAQNSEYKSGTVTYKADIIADSITGAFDRINVKNYGVKGDGVTDDTEAIRKLFSGQSGNFYFPSGTYKITGTITLSSESIMYGDGDQTVIDMHDCNDLAQCTFRGGEKVWPYILVTGRNTKLHDFKLIGSSTTQVARHAGVGVLDTDNCFISNLTIYNINYDANQSAPDASGYGICVLRSYRVYIDHCYVEQCGYECIGIVDMSHHCSVSNCIAKNGWRTCIQVHRGAYDVDIVNNQMIQDSQAWDACFTLHGLQDDLLVRNLRIENNTFKATVAPRTRNEWYAAVVQLMAYCDGLWFINNRVEAGDRNLAAHATVTHLTIMGNVFQCNDTSTYRLNVQSENAVIVGNVLENTEGTTQTIPASAALAGNVGIS